MISTRSILRRHAGSFFAVATISLGLSVAPTDVLAYTAEQQQACSGDAMRLCGAFVPDVDRITVCMMQNKAQLTPGCRAFFGPAPTAMHSGNARRSKPVSLKPHKRQPRVRH
ncbi:hypothetical protein LOC51_35960 [Rubrivivax sp. JA1024]|nr:hypothetical protein [Rubrivivax sp. JA1024]